MRAGEQSAAHFYFLRIAPQRRAPGGRALAPRGSAEDRAMAKPTTIKIRLNSTADTGYFYVAKKNSRTMTEKMVVRKYDPIAKKHVEFKEGKIK